MIREAERFALHWVQDNISRFGGDASKVTMYVFLLLINAEGNDEINVIVGENQLVQLV